MLLVVSIKSVTQKRTQEKFYTGVPILLTRLAKLGYIKRKAPCPIALRHPRRHESIARV